MTRHLLTGEELSPDDVTRIVTRAGELKADPLASQVLAGRSVALIFEKPSTRTRVSFETGVAELGGHPLVLRSGELQLSRGESIRDTALVLSRHVAAIGIRTGPDADVEELAAHASVPVVNMLTAGHHPCQALADLQTLQERFGRLDGLKLAYVGDGNNVARSLAILGAKAGVQVAVASPPGYELDPVAAAQLTNDPAEAVAGAHAVYTDVWASMGQEQEAVKRKKAFRAYQVNGALFALARPDAVFMHCLPAKRDEEVTDSIMEHERSVVFDQAENRLHAQKALLMMMLA